MIKTLLNFFPNLHPGALYRPALMILWVLLALATRDAVPVFFWFTMLTMPAFVLYKTEREYFRQPSFRNVLIICGGLFLFHCAWALYISSTYNPASEPTYWHDDVGYFNQASAIAQAWKAGFFPDIHLKGSPPYLGTLHTGYHRPLASLFLLAGPSAFVGLMLNAICASLLPLFAALSAKYLWTDELASKTGRPANVGVAAALLTALHPGQFYWASFLLKDVFTAFAFMAALTFVIGAWRCRSSSMVMASLLLLPYTFTIRAYMAMSLIAGALCVPLLKLPRKRVYTLAAIGSIVLYMTCSYTRTGSALYEQLRDSFVALAPAGLTNPLSLVKQTLQGIPALFLAPYAWLVYPEPMPLYGLYPGMWYLYLFIYPLAFSGLYSAIRRNLQLAVIPLAVLGLSSLVFLMAVYAGVAPRQRYFMEYAFILFAAYGLYRPSKPWIASILLLELIFGIGQVISLQY